MFPVMKKRREYLKESLKDKGGPVGAAPNDEQDGDHAALAEHHKTLAEHHHALSEEHAKFAGVGTTDEAEGEGQPAAEAPYGDPEEGDVVGFGAGESSDRPPDTVETAKYGPVEEEEEESPEHEAGETKEVEAIEQSRKPSLGLPGKAGHSLRNADEKGKPLSKGGRSFRPFKKGGSFRF
jgi:hypothetical protein